MSIEPIHVISGASFDVLSGKHTLIQIQRGKTILFSESVEEMLVDYHKKQIPYTNRVSDALASAHELAIQMAEEIGQIKPPIPPVQYTHVVTAAEMKHMHEKTEGLKALQNSHILHLVIIYVLFLITAVVFLLQ